MSKWSVGITNFSAAPLDCIIWLDSEKCGAIRLVLCVSDWYYTQKLLQQSLWTYWLNIFSFPVTYVQVYLRLVVNCNHAPMWLHGNLFWIPRPNVLICTSVTRVSCSLGLGFWIISSRKHVHALCLWQSEQRHKRHCWMQCWWKSAFTLYNTSLADVIISLDCEIIRVSTWNALFAWSACWKSLADIQRTYMYECINHVWVQ